MLGSETSITRLPVSIITGFLGSGKTTLIANLLRKPEMAGTGVIVNEFAALGIDDLVLSAERQDGGEVILLKNGCVCCAPTDDLTTAILRLQRNLTSSPIRSGRLLIETSGLADPVTLLHRLMRDLRLRTSIRLAGVVGLVDAVNGLAQLDAHEVSLKQIAIADRRVISKNDLVAPERLEQLKQRLHAINPGSPIIVGQANAQVDASLLDGGLYNEQRGELDPLRWLGLPAYRQREPAHKELFQTWLIESDSAVRWEMFTDLMRPLIMRENNGLLRLKGLLYTLGDDAPLVIHGVQNDFYRPVRLARWPDQRRRTMIVVIGHAFAAATVDGIRKALADCALESPLANAITQA